MAERIILDPSEVATGRTELDITPWIRADDGVDWGSGEIAAYMAEAERGQVPVDFRMPNRQVQIPLVLQERGGTAFATFRSLVQAKAALFQREGGWIKRVSSTGGTVFADIVNATLGLPGSWSQAHRDYDIGSSLSLECIPDLYGAETSDLTDDFSTDTIGSGLWAFDEGSGTVSVSGGQLVPSSTATKRMYRADREFYDCQVTAKHTTPSPTTGYEFGVSAKRIDGSNYLFALATPTALLIYKRDGGANTSLATTAITALSISTSYWLRLRIEGNKVTAEHFTADPASGTPANTVTHTLAGGDATKFGLGIQGEAGIGWWSPGTTAARVDDFSVSPNVYVETTEAELVRTIYGIEGDYPGRCRIVVDEKDAETQLGLLWGFRSRHYSAAVTAQLEYEAEDLTTLDAAATTNATGASGGASNAVEHASLSINWTPVLSTQDDASSAHMTHTGTYRVWVRASTSSESLPELRLVWEVGDLALPEENAPVAFPGAGDKWYMLDLGEVRLDAPPVGAHRWEGQIQARGAAGGEYVALDKVWFVPVDDGYAVLRAPLTVWAPSLSFASRDSFKQTAGALSGKISDSGHTWSAAGDPDGFQVNATDDAAERTAVSDVVDAGHVAPIGSNVSGVVAQVDVKSSDISTSVLAGLLVRYVDVNNYANAKINFTAAGGVARVSMARRTGGGSYSAWSPFNSTFAPATNTFYTIRVAVTTSGNWAIWVIESGGAFGDPLLVGHAVEFAVGGVLASGKVGLFDYRTSATAATRQYRNFQAWELPADAVLHASQSAEVRWDGMFREDSTGTAYGPVSHVVGDLPRMPVGGTTEIFLKGSRGDLDQLPDPGIDDISARVYYRPSWLFVPGS